jgi:hypothetical protein
MTTQTTGETTADRQRARSMRGVGRSAGGSQARLPSPPRQRRPMMAVLAVLLIAGGALLALVLAMQLDSREDYMVAKRSIPAGAEVTEADFTPAKVAADDGVPLLSEADLGLLAKAGPMVARSRIARGQLINQDMFVQEHPLASGDYAMVSVLLTPGLAPDEKTIRAGDIVTVIRAAQESGSGTGRTLTEGFVQSKDDGAEDGLGGTSVGSVTLLVPSEAAEAVVDAAANNRAGLAIVSRNNGLDGLSLAVAGN